MYTVSEMSTFSAVKLSLSMAYHGAVVECSSRAMTSSLPCVTVVGRHDYEVNDVDSAVCTVSENELTDDMYRAWN